MREEKDEKQITVSDHRYQSEDKDRVVPSLNLKLSTSPVNKSNENVSSRLCDSKLNMKRNSFVSVRDVKTSYSEADNNRSETLINKWVDEDFCSLTTNREQNLFNEQAPSGEILVPFHRTASATLFTESIASQDIPSEKGLSNDQQLTTGNSADRKVLRNGRLRPEVQSTRTSRLRETKLESKNTSFANRRKKHGVDRPQQTVQKSKQHKVSHEISNDQVDLSNKYKNTSIDQGIATTNIPSVSTDIFLQLTLSLLEL